MGSAQVRWVRVLSSTNALLRNRDFFNAFTVQPIARPVRRAVRHKTMPMTNPLGARGQMAGRTHFGFSLRVALPPSHGFAARRPRRREVIFNPREVLARGEGVHRIADESTLAEVFSLRQSLHKRWVALARRVDEIPGAQTL